MPINKSYDEEKVIRAIAKALEDFYNSLIAKIDKLDIKAVMKRKNPYLYRAKAMQSASEIVESVLNAYISSSEETIFGNCFFEPIAIAASNGNKAFFSPSYVNKTGILFTSSDKKIAPRGKNFMLNEFAP